MSNPPKALLFDIGGVVVVSPFQAILDYERDHSIPIGYVNYAISKCAPNGAFHKLERGEIPLDESFFRAFESDIRREDLWKAHHMSLSQKGRLAQKIPPVPAVDGKRLFWSMMGNARGPDPYMFPALLRLRRSGKFVMGALSNAVIFPAGIKNADGEVYQPGLQLDAIRDKVDREDVEGLDRDMQRYFDTFVHSAQVGMRKPHPDAYREALRRLQDCAQKQGRGRIEARDVLFLDDIGQNLKTARELGFRTIKVNLGRTVEAVRELEKVTGLELVRDEGGKAKL